MKAEFKTVQSVGKLLMAFWNTKEILEFLDHGGNSKCRLLLHNTASPEAPYLEEMSWLSHRGCDPSPHHLPHHVITKLLK
jgi:hypothetical protein